MDNLKLAQQDGLSLAQSLGLLFTLLIGLTILFLSIAIAVTVPRNPLPTPDLKLGENESQDQKKLEIENYEKLTTALHLQATRTFKLIVSDTLLPVFNTLLATLLGFIFVRKTAEVINSYLTRRENLRLERDASSGNIKTI